MRIVHPSRARRYVAVFGTSLTLSITAILATPRAAHAWDGSAPGEIYNAATWQCLDSDAAGDVYTAPCDGSNHQVWQYTSDGNLQDAQTGLCLTDYYYGPFTAQCENGLLKEDWTYSTAVVPAALRIFTGSGEFCLDAYMPDSSSIGYVYDSACEGRASEDWYVFY